MFVFTTGVVFAQTFPAPYQLSEPLPGSPNRAVGSLAEYLSLAYISLLSASIAFGLVMLVYSGVEYITAGGNQNAIKSAKDRMFRIAKGFIIIVGAVLLLTTLGGDSLLEMNFDIRPTGTPFPTGNNAPSAPTGNE
ncbi:MAG: hypothetical protein AAB343_00495 [Patescibacteria group bacterium]